MINYYQPWLLPFLQAAPRELPIEIKSYYYHSFEDGLWDLIDHKFPPAKKLTILVPDFYCSDVLDNIKNRGHEYIYYPLDSHFQIAPSKIQRYISTFAPDIVIVFHACGITSNLLIDTSWLPMMPENSLIIEDSVHRLVDPARLRIIDHRHFIIDSLRKVSPLPGSRVFGSPAALSFPQTRHIFSFYTLSSFFFYLLFRLILIVGFITGASRIVAFAHHRFLKAHDDIIGDSLTPHRGLPVFLPLINRFNYRKLENLKTLQVALYEKYLSKLFSSEKFYQISIPRKDSGLLHVYPLGFNSSPVISRYSLLLSRNYPVWFKFTDTPWSQNRGVVFLPLGFHMDESKIKLLAKAIVSN